MNAQDIETEALRLAPTSRARLAERLLHSLDSLTQEEREELWINEAERRDIELDEGLAQSRLAEEVFRDARANLS